MKYEILGQELGGKKNAITVDSNGMIRAVGLGKATITAKASNGKSASITVESTVSRIGISITSGGQYISAFGTKTSVDLRATVSPIGFPTSYKVSWSAPDTTGSTGPAYSNMNGNSITITAREIGGSSIAKIPVYAYIGSKESSKIDIYVEPELVVTTDQTCTTTSGKKRCANLSGKTITFTSNFDIEWQFSPTSVVKNHNKTNRSLTIEFYSCTSGYNGSNVKAVSKSGQLIEYVLDC